MRKLAAFILSLAVGTMMIDPPNSSEGTDRVQTVL